MRNRRRENIQAKKRLDWRDDDLPIFTRVLEETGTHGMFQKRPVVLTPDEMQDMCQVSLRAALTNPGLPTYDKDDLYFAAKNLKTKRKAARTRALNKMAKMKEGNR